MSLLAYLMLNQRTFFLVVFLLILTLFWQVTPTFAAQLTTASIRLDRHKVSTSPGNILITITPTTTATEDAFQLIFGSGWSIQSSPSSFTISTSGLPAGTTAWPGIGTATGVGGQTVTFPSGNLNPGTTYGFFLTGGLPTNPSTAGSLAIYQITAATRAGGSTIDSSTVDVPLVNNDQIVVTAQILPPLSDFSAELSTASDTVEIPQDSTIEYLITYGSTYHSSQPITLVAEWSQGTIAGSGTPSVDLLEYVAGSATEAYGSTAPVVDVGNRTITWTISSFPGNTSGETVSFSLKTTDEYTGGLTVTATTAARITNPVTTTDSSSSTSYIYYAPPASTSSGGSSSTSSNSSSSTSTTTTAASPTPTPSTTPLQFYSYQLKNKTHELAEYLLSLSTPATVTASYGTTPDSLTMSVSSPTNSLYHWLLLPNLLPNTTYYVQFTAIAPSGEQISSELLTVTTTKMAEYFDLTNVTLFSQGLHIFTYSNNQQPTLLVPTQSQLEYTLSFLEAKHGSTFTLMLENSSQLKYGTLLTQSQPTIWTGKLLTPTIPGNYTVIVQWETPLGSKQTIPIGILKVSTPITIVDGDTHNPIERARIRLWSYSEVTKLYDELISTDTTTGSFSSTTQGTLPLVLRPGIYKISIEALGFKGQTTTFNTNELSNFPLFTLQPESFPFISTIFYHLETAVLKITRLMNALREEAQSSATLRLLTLLTICLTTPFTLLGLLAQSHFSFKTLLQSLHSRQRYIVGKGFGKYQFKHGTVLANTKAIHNAVVTVLDATGKTKMVLQTHKSGQLAVPERFLQPGTTLTTFAPGYASQTVALEPNREPFTINLVEQTTQNTLLQLLKQGVTHLLTQAVELNLITSVAVGILFTFVYGSAEAVPFLAISSLNSAVYLHTQLSAFLHTRSIS